MRNVWHLACGAFAVGGIIVACGGSSETDLFGAPNGDATGSSSSSTSSSGGDAASGSSSTSSSSGGGSSSGGSSSGNASSSGSNDAGPKTCRPSVPSDCGDGEFCKVATCNQTTGGTCTKRPKTVSQDYLPVCGCDDVTYWNPEVMAQFGVSPKAQGICAKGLACDDLTKCPDKRFCNRQLDAAGYCAAAVTLDGTCWGLPPNCPGLSNGKARPCGANPNQCKTYCEAVRAEDPWFADNNCN